MRLKSHEAEQKYLQYRSRRKLFSWIFGIICWSLIMFSFVYLFCVAEGVAFGEFDTNVYVGLVFAGMLVSAVWIIHLGSNKKERVLFKEAYEPEEDIREGVFLDIWQEYERYCFKDIFDEQTTVQKVFDYDGLIQIDLERNGSEMSINIACDSVYMLVTSADEPVELIIDMDDIATLEAFFGEMRRFVYANS